MLDYQGALTVAGVGLLSGVGVARTAGLVLGGSGVGVALFTDYRLSLKKLIPIEVHEVIDYVWSAAVIAAPFLFGYSRRSRAGHLGAGFRGREHHRRLPRHRLPGTARRAVAQGIEDGPRPRERLRPGGEPPGRGLHELVQLSDRFCELAAQEGAPGRAAYCTRSAEVERWYMSRTQPR